MVRSVIRVLLNTLGLNNWKLGVLAGIPQLVEQQTFMQQVPGSIPTQPDWGLIQPSIPLWVGKMSTSKNIG